MGADWGLVEGTKTGGVVGVVALWRRRGEVGGGEPGVHDGSRPSSSIPGTPVLGPGPGAPRGEMLQCPRKTSGQPYAVFRSLANVHFFPS